MAISWSFARRYRWVFDLKAYFKKTSDTLKHRIYGYLTARCRYYTDDPISRGLRLSQKRLKKHS